MLLLVVVATASLGAVHDPSPDVNVNNAASAPDGLHANNVRRDYQHGYHDRKSPVPPPERPRRYNWDSAAAARLYITNFILNALIIVYMVYIMWMFIRSKHRQGQLRRAKAEKAKKAEKAEKAEKAKKAMKDAQMREEAPSTWAVGSAFEDCIAPMD
jgi:hypothetical protein